MRQTVEEIDAIGAAPEYAGIDDAIKVHGLWLARLKQALESGASDLRPEVVGRDNACEFGEWLQRYKNERIGASELFQEIKILHAEFHVTAARILLLALQGDREEALQKMRNKESDFIQLSGKLILALRALQNELKYY